jgi:hypothetical protein
MENSKWKGEKLARLAGFELAAFGSTVRLCAFFQLGLII